MLVLSWHPSFYFRLYWLVCWAQGNRRQLEQPCCTDWQYLLIRELWLQTFVFASFFWFKTICIGAVVQLHVPDDCCVKTASNVFGNSMAWRSLTATEFKHIWTPDPCFSKKAKSVEVKLPEKPPASSPIKQGVRQTNHDANSTKHVPNIFYPKSTSNEFHSSMRLHPAPAISCWRIEYMHSDKRGFSTSRGGL